MCANAQGFGQALMAAGNPIAGWVMSHDEMELSEWDYSRYQGAACPQVIIVL